MKTMLKSKARAYVFFAAILFAFVLVLFFCLLMLNSINRKMNESATSNLLNTTRVISDTFEGLFERDFDSLAVVGSLYSDGSRASTEQLLSFRNTMELDWLGVVDASLKGTDCFGNAYNINDYPEAAEWNLRERGFSDAFVGALSGRQQITLWVPVYKGDEYLGAVLGNIILTQYYSANIFTFYEGEGRTYIFDGTDGSWVLKSLGTDGTAVRVHDIYSLLEASGNDRQDIETFKATVEASLQGTAIFNFNGEQSYLCFLPLPFSPNWYVTTVIAKDVLLRESSEIQWTIVVLMCFLFVVLAVAAIAFSTWLARKAKMQEIHYREALFGNISANLDSAFIIYEKATRKIGFVSDNFKRLLGIDPEWIYEDAARLFDWCKIPQDNPKRREFLEGSLNSPTIEEVSVENEMGEVSRAIRLELIPADLGQELAVLTDITKDKEIHKSLMEMMEAAKNASVAKNNFLSAMSHDLRTPINGIVGMTAIAAANIDDKNRVLDCLTKVSQSTEHLLGLINEVLDMSQIESGKIALASEPFNLAALLKNVLSINYPGIQQKNHTVNVHVHLMEHEEVIGDPDRLTSVAVNLISNAIKYTPSGGTINIILRECPPMIEGYGCYELTVQDNGIGMLPQFKEKLFEPFEREEDVRIGRIQGTGLGMSITKSVVEMMMGSIEVESEKGKGSTFRVTFNLRLNEQGASYSTAPLAGLPVLVVDDDVDCCESVAEILCSIGMTGECAYNGATAVEMVVKRHAQSSDYLAVVLDWKMPDMDGIETARQIRHKVGADVPIIILSAYEWGEIEAEAREAGVDMFLSKPIYKASLIQKMLEITQGQPPAIESSLSLIRKSVPQGRRVLIAEDNELNKEIAVELLRMIGVETDCANDGVEAVDKFASAPSGSYDIIFMDIQMPKMNGYEATRAIRKLNHPDGKTIPIIAMTADAFKKDEQAAKEAGMNAHLAKPISVERLYQVLKQYLKEEDYDD